MWGAAFGMTVFRGSFQWILQRRLFADDYFIIAGFVTLTALTAVITCMLPQFYLAGEYTKAAAKDPLAPLPLAPEEFIGRTIASLKLMFCQMLLFWTTLWAGMFLPSLIGTTKTVVNNADRICVMNSKVLHSLLRTKACHRTAQIHSRLVGVLRCGLGAVSSLHAFQLFDMHTVDEVLEC